MSKIYNNKINKQNISKGKITFLGSIILLTTIGYYTKLNSMKILNIEKKYEDKAVLKTGSCYLGSKKEIELCDQAKFEEYGEEEGELTLESETSDEQSNQLSNSNKSNISIAISSPNENKIIMTPFLWAIQASNIMQIKLFLENNIDDINEIIEEAFIEKLFPLYSIQKIKASLESKDLKDCKNLRPLDFALLRNPKPTIIYLKHENMQAVFHTLLEFGAKSEYLEDILIDQTAPKDDLIAVKQYRDLKEKEEKLEFIKKLEQEENLKKSLIEEINPYSYKTAKEIIYLCVYRKYPNSKELKITKQANNYLNKIKKKSKSTLDDTSYIFYFTNIKKYLDDCIEFKAFIASKNFENIKKLPKNILENYLIIAKLLELNYIKKLEDFSNTDTLEKEHKIALQEIKEINIDAYKNRVNLIKRLHEKSI